jgi:ABC-2 type transport system ATP-binding protein
LDATAAHPPASMPPADALRVAAVSHAYGSRKALDAVTLTVERGRFVALLGLNGAGKTTLVSLISGLFHARQGTVAILGHDIGRHPTAALARLGIVFQARTLDLDLSVHENLLLHAALHGLSRREGRARAEALLARLGLADRAADPVRALSGGQQRRVEIARALIHRPALLVLDEPTVGLDAAARRELLALVRRLVAEDGLGVLWATHLFDEIAPDDAVVVLHRGRVRFAGSAAALAGHAGATSIGGGFAALTETAGEGER